MKSNKISIFDINFFVEKKAAAFATFEDAIKHNREMFVVTANPEILLKTLKNYDYRKIIQRAHVILPDGIGIQWAASFKNDNAAFKDAKFANIFLFAITVPISLIRFLFSKTYQTKAIPERITGVDTITALAKYAEHHNKSIYLLGAGKDIAKKAAKNLCEKFPKLVIAGTHEGSPEKEHKKEIISKINASNADILLVAFGAPAQEKWLYENRFELKPSFLMGVGGSFDFLSKNIKRAPKKIQSKFEWLWRLIQEPKKRWKRIINAVFVFPYYVALEKLYKHRPYRPNVLAVILNSKKQFLVLNNSYLSKRHNEESHWQFMQGGIEKNESDEEALFREIEEEIGNKKVEIIQQSEIEYSYLWPLTNLRIKRPFKGQKQKIWYIKYLGEDSEITVDPKEHSDFKWIEKQDIFDVIHPVRSEITQMILEEMLKKNILNKIS